MQNLILTPLQTAFFRSLSMEDQNAIARIYFGIDALNPADDADINYKVFMALGRSEAAAATATAPAKAEAVATSTSAASAASDPSKQSDLVDAPTAPTQAAPTSATAPMSAVATASTAPQSAVDASHIVDEFSHELVDTDKVATRADHGAAAGEVGITDHDYRRRLV